MLTFRSYYNLFCTDPAAPILNQSTKNKKDMKNIMIDDHFATLNNKNKLYVITNKSKYAPVPRRSCKSILQPTKLIKFIEEMKWSPAAERNSCEKPIF